MVEKEIKKAAVSKTEKKVEPTVRAKKEPTVKAEPKKVEPKNTEPKKAKPMKAEPKKITAAAERPVEELVPAKAKAAVKEEEPKKKRISKGLATHNRRVKQEKRHPGMPKKKIK